MKRIILTLVSVVSLVFASAQNAVQTPVQNPFQTPVQKAFPKSIQVTGTAEMEIIPDEIHIMVTLSEYEKKGKGKTDLETIRKDFLVAVRQSGIADSSISIASMGGNNGAPW